MHNMLVHKTQIYLHNEVETILQKKIMYFYIQPGFFYIKIYMSYDYLCFNSNF